MKYLHSLPCCGLDHWAGGEPSLGDFVLLSGSDPGCLHSAAGEAPYCLDKLPNTQRVKVVQVPTCRDVFVPSVLCLTLCSASMKTGTIFLRRIPMLTGVLDVQKRPTVFLVILQRDSWNWKENAPTLVLCQWSHSVLSLSILISSSVYLFFCRKRRVFPVDLLIWTSSSAAWDFPS